MRPSGRHENSLGRTTGTTRTTAREWEAPVVMNGTPCFRGTRVPFKNLIDYLEGGHSLSEFLRQFPTVTREMAVQALEEGKDSAGRVPTPRFPAQLSQP